MTYHLNHDMTYLVAQRPNVQSKTISTFFFYFFLLVSMENFINYKRETKEQKCSYKVPTASRLTNNATSVGGIEKLQNLERAKHLSYQGHQHTCLPPYNSVKFGLLEFSATPLCSQPR